jgi:PAS domain S-box-containing protein
MINEAQGPIAVSKPADSLDRFRSFFDRSGICVATLDQNAKVIEANVDLVRQFGRPPSDIRGRSFCDLLHPSVRDKIGHQFARLAARQRARFDEGMIAVRPDDTVFSGELTGIAVHGGGGIVENLMVLVRPDQNQRGEQLLTRRKQLLTDMETRVLEGVAAGVSTVQLASMLYLSRGGVEYHVTMLLRKLKVNNRPALVSKAYSMGIFRLGSWPPRVLPDYMK